MKKSHKSKVAEHAKNHANKVGSTVHKAGETVDTTAKMASSKVGGAAVAKKSGSLNPLLLLALLLTLAFGVFAFSRLSEADETVSDGESLLEGTGGDSSKATDENNTDEGDDTVEVPAAAGLTLGLSDAWTQTSTETTEDACGDGVDWTKTEYSSTDGATMMVIENGNINGCDGAVGADVTLDYDFAGTGIAVNDSAVEFCTKAADALCPAGNSILEVAIANMADDGTYEKDRNGNSHYFYITSTTLQDNLVAQIQGYADEVESAVIN